MLSWNWSWRASVGTSTKGSPHCPFAVSHRSIAVWNESERLLGRARCLRAVRRTQTEFSADCHDSTSSPVIALFGAQVLSSSNEHTPADEELLLRRL